MHAVNADLNMQTGRHQELNPGSSDRQFGSEHCGLNQLGQRDRQSKTVTLLYITFNKDLHETSLPRRKSIEVPHQEQIVIW